MSDPPRDRQGGFFYRVDCSGPHPTVGKKIDVSTPLWVAGRTDALIHAQRVGRVYRGKRGWRTARHS